MNRDHPVLNGVICGLSVGVLLLILKRFGVDTSFAVPALNGVLVIMLDYICLKPIFDGRRYERLMSFGNSADARIEEVVDTVIHPKYYVADENGKAVLPPDRTNIPAAYNVRINYQASGREYTKEVYLPPKTPLEIYPYVIEAGASIPVRYAEGSPGNIIIAIPAIAEEIIASKREYRYKGPFAAIIMTAIFVVFIIARNI